MKHYAVVSVNAGTIGLIAAREPHQPGVRRIVILAKKPTLDGKIREVTRV
jgi:hypothetical protein